VFLAITFFTVLDLAAVGLRAALALEALALDARAVVLDELRLAAAAFFVGVLFADFAILLERVVLLDTTCAWNRHAPVHGLSGESSHLRPIKGAETDSGFLNVPKIAHFPQKSMIYDQSRGLDPL
jgi:hypothetical protein